MTRLEITEVDVDDETKSAMQQQLNAERKHRGSVTEAEGRKQATQLDAAEKEAMAKKILADAEAIQGNKLENCFGAQRCAFFLKRHYWAHCF